MWTFLILLLQLYLKRKILQAMAVTFVTGLDLTSAIFSLFFFGAFATSVTRTGWFPSSIPSSLYNMYSQMSSTSDQLSRKPEFMGYSINKLMIIYCGHKLLSIDSIVRLLTSRLLALWASWNFSYATYLILSLVRNVFSMKHHPSSVAE